MRKVMNVDNEYVKQKTQQIIENYKEKAGVNDKIKVFTSDDGKKYTRNTVPTWLKNGEEWENPVTGKQWKRDENGYLSAGRRDKVNVFSPKICPKCKDYLKSQNSINIRLQTGKCIKCHSDAELDAIVSGKEYEAPDWKGEILIKDSMGRIIMNIDEYQQEYGDHLTFMFLTKLVHELDEKRGNDIKINEHIYENAKTRRDNLKEKINDEIKSMNEVVEKMIEEGEISEDMSDEDITKVLKKLNNNQTEKQNEEE